MNTTTSRRTGWTAFALLATLLGAGCDSGTTTPLATGPPAATSSPTVTGPMLSGTVSISGAATIATTTFTVGAQMENGQQPVSPPSGATCADYANGFTSSEGKGFVVPMLQTYGYHNIFVGVTIAGGYNGPAAYTSADTPLLTGSAVEGIGTTSAVYTVFHAKDQGAITVTVNPDGSGSLTITHWDSDEVRQTAGESQVNINGIVNWSCSAWPSCVLASPPGKSEAAEEQNHDHDDEDENKHGRSVRACNYERRSAAGPNFQPRRSKTGRPRHISVGPPLNRRLPSCLVTVRRGLTDRRPPRDVGRRPPSPLRPLGGWGVATRCLRAQSGRLITPLPFPWGRSAHEEFSGAKRARAPNGRLGVTSTQILVVDDSVVPATLSRLLRHHGFDVVPAAAGVRGRRIWRSPCRDTGPPAN